MMFDPEYWVEPDGEGNQIVILDGRQIGEKYPSVYEAVQFIYTHMMSSSSERVLVIDPGRYRIGEE